MRLFFKIAFFLIPLVLQAEDILFQESNPQFAHRQPIEAIFVDQQGNEFSQPVYFNAYKGGVEIPNSSAYSAVHFPAAQSSYYWKGGAWQKGAGYSYGGGYHHGYAGGYTSSHQGGFGGGNWNAHEGHHGEWHGENHEGQGGYGFEGNHNHRSFEGHGHERENHHFRR